MSEPEVKVSRDGTVTRSGRLVGYVDRYDQNGHIRPGWRWVLDGGRHSRTRFRTRTLAVTAMTQANGSGDAHV
jgi:hypothetical protein